MSAPSTAAGPVLVATRSSRLARAQSGTVAERLTTGLSRPVRLVDVTTRGDVDSAPLPAIGGEGVFVSALRAALVAGDVDVAVHSLKDLPTEPVDGIELAAVPVREDPRDVLVARDGLTLGELPPGSTVGTGSPRRAAQLRALGLGMEVVDLRGNVDTRLDRVAAGGLDAVVVARAGLARLGRLDEVTEALDPLQMLPAPGQGALAVECRAGDPLADSLRRLLDDPDTRAAVTAERAFLAAVGAGCSAPVGALAELVLVDPDADADVDTDAGGSTGAPDELWLRAAVIDPTGYPLLRSSTTGAPDQPEHVGHRLATEMLADGAAELVGPAAGAEP